jgi:hypothetical protein
MRGRTARRANDLLFLAVLVVLGIGCAAGLYLVLAQILLHIPLDPNEGWNAYHAQAVIAGTPLYPGRGSLMINNYPPLSFTVVGLSGLVTGDAIIAGRILSLLAFLAIALLISAIARAMGAGLRPALFGALLFASTLLLGSDYVGMNDPQLLGEAVSLAALFVLVKAPRTVGRIVGAAALFVVAAFIKHNLVVMPLGAAIWLLLYTPRFALLFVNVGLLLAGVAVLAYGAVTGTNLLAELNSARSYSWAAASLAAWNWLALAFVPLVGTALLPLLDRDNPNVRFLAILAILGVLAGYYFLGGAGVDVNAMFDADIALALASALLLERLSMRYGIDGIAAAILAAPFAITLYLAATPDWFTGNFWLRPGADDAETAGKNIAYLRAHPGPALCETLSLCYWAGKDAQVDVFNLGQAYKTGARSDAALVALIREKYYATVEFETFAPFALTERVREVLLANYRVDHVDDDGVFLVPR